jgi:hypothetical protein
VKDEVESLTTDQRILLSIDRRLKALEKALGDVKEVVENIENIVWGEDDDDEDESGGVV